MAPEKKHRTWICSVLFTDIVSYTEFDVEEQMNIRRHFYALVDEELSNYNSEDYITLDAGDGMAICYLGDPEDILLMALSLRDAFLRIQSDNDIVSYEVRLGINLGPVKIAELQGEKRVIGDAINVANRIMGFAGPNQLYVSRSYYEVVSHLSKEYFNMFDFVGTREDKHVRKHELYTVGSHQTQTNHSPETAAEQTPSNRHAQHSATSSQATANPAAHYTPELLTQLEQRLSQHIGPLARVLIKKKAARAKDTKQLLELLTEEIEDVGAKRLFQQACKKLL